MARVPERFAPGPYEPDEFTASDLRQRRRNATRGIEEQIGRKLTQKEELELDTHVNPPSMRSPWGQGSAPSTERAPVPTIEADKRPTKVRAEAPTIKAPAGPTKVRPTSNFSQPVKAAMAKPAHAVAARPAPRPVPLPPRRHTSLSQPQRPSSISQPQRQPIPQPYPESSPKFIGPRQTSTPAQPTSEQLSPEDAALYRDFNTALPNLPDDWGGGLDGKQSDDAAFPESGTQPLDPQSAQRLIPGQNAQFNPGATWGPDGVVRAGTNRQPLAEGSFPPGVTWKATPEQLATANNPRTRNQPPDVAGALKEAERTISPDMYAGGGNARTDAQDSPMSPDLMEWLMGEGSRNAIGQSRGANGEPRKR